MDEKETIEFCEECLDRFKSGRLAFSEISLVLSDKVPDLLMTANVLEHFGITGKVGADAAYFAKDKGATLCEHLKQNIGSDTKIFYDVSGYHIMFIRLVFEVPADCDIKTAKEKLASIMAPYEYTDEQLLILCLTGNLRPDRLFHILETRGGHIVSISNKQIIGFCVNPNRVK